MLKRLLRREKPLLSKGMQNELIFILISLVIFLSLMAFLVAKRFKEAGL